MDAAEEIVTKWLNKQGYFTINNKKLGNNKEIDILAYGPMVKKYPKRLHVEVQVSTKPVKGDDVSEPTVTSYCYRKFVHEISKNNDERIQDHVSALFNGEDYTNDW